MKTPNEVTERSNQEEANDPAMLGQDEIRPDRLVAFSDGVFAIAITLLVFTIHVPQPQELRSQSLLTVLIDPAQLSSYLSFLLSFLIVGVVWGNHHTMFSYIKRTNHMLIVLNLLLLLDVVLLPFFASLLGLYTGTAQQQIAVQLYSGSLVVGGIFYNLLWAYASRGHRLLDRQLSTKVVEKVTRRYFFGPVLYLLAFALSFVWNGVPGLIFCVFLAILYLLPTVADRVKLNR